MRKLTVLVLAAAALSACASDVDQRQAAIQCQQVGISPSSSEYSLCLQSYTAQRREQALNEDNLKALNPPPRDRRIAE